MVRSRQSLRSGNALVQLGNLSLRTVDQAGSSVNDCLRAAEADGLSLDTERLDRDDPGKSELRSTVAEIDVVDAALEKCGVDTTVR